MKISKFSESFGLIVIVDNTYVVLIERKIPYVVLQYQMNHRKQNNFQHFLFHYLPRQNSDTQLDYRRFIGGFSFEDQYDFPHGQKEKREADTFKIAFREFEEETGFTFVANEDVPVAKTIRFRGLDGYDYTQHYYVVHVSELIPCGIKDDIYIPRVMDIGEARNLLEKQQLVKKDGKHLLF